jgi:hypothetical protein
MSIYVATVARSLKPVLNAIIDDTTDGMEAATSFQKWMEVGPSEDSYETDLETGGPGLASEKTEGGHMAIGTIAEGVQTQYRHRTFALKMVVTEEALEDSKYKDKVIKAAKRLKRALWKTAEIDGCNVLARGFNTVYVGGDGLPLFSASHTLPQGGTFSNLMGTAMTPSRMALIAAKTMAMQMVGHDGVREGYELTGILCPSDQWATWQGIVTSEKVPESNFNEPNVVKKLGLEVYPLIHWSSSSTNWAVQTNAPDGLKWFWRRRPRSKTWVDNDQGLMKYSIDARWSRLWSDARGVIGNNA